MGKIIISVIIPVYNVEKYLKQCLDSIINQTLKNIEVICINDCSTDNSLNILKEFASKDSRIKIIDLKQNEGVSNARNSGLNIAQGKYIYLIDSDDWIDNNYLEVMVQKIEESNSNILINANFVNEYPDKQKKLYSKFDFLKSDFETINSRIIQRYFPPVIWTRLYRRTYIEKYKFRFPQVKCGAEDIYFAYACDLMQEQVCIFKGPYHHYFQHISSAMHKKERGYYYFESFKLLYDFLTKKNVNLNGIKLFFVESLIIDTKKKFNFIKNYLSEIEQIFNRNTNIYNLQELFLFKILKESINFEFFISKYNPNIALSFLKYKMSIKK